jgi:Alpha-L-rhamnosidase N-terminal domain./Bacterial alpha-L-rhamnosidase.
MIKYFILSLMVVSLPLIACAEKAVVEIRNLRCEGLSDPQGIGCISPRLSWELNSDTRDVHQESYRILVASSLEKLKANNGDLWDSKKVKSNHSVLIPYTGKALDSRTECYWKVQVSTNKGISGWSEAASWSVGLLNSFDWQGQWIGLDKTFPGDVLEGHTRLAARYFRKAFVIDKEIKQAVLYISGLGLYECFINNNRIGAQELSPTPTDYAKRAKYNTFDVTKPLMSGNNAIGVVLGNGFFFSSRTSVPYGVPPIERYGFPKMLLQLEINYTDGTREIIASDNSWKVTADGPIRANNEFDGEEYDARKEMPSWSYPGFEDSAWLPVELVDAPQGKLEAQLNRNIKVMEKVNPISIKEVKDGMYVMDMGQNMVGWLRMSVKGKKGTKVTLRFAEILKDDGTIYTANLREAKATDTYILKGESLEEWNPSFTYHGFRFVEITGYPGKPTIENFEGQVLYDEMPTTGSFETSDTTINQIYKNAYWGIRGNYRGIPTDCPQRDERLGWLGDRTMGSYGESFIFENNNLYAKWLDDIADSQIDNGSIPNVAPAYWKIYSDNMTWPGAYLSIANMLYEQYGNKEPIVKHYDSMKKWLYYMRDTYLVDNIMPQETYGDWCMPPESPELIHSKDPARKTDFAVTGTTFYYRMLYFMERFANLQNKSEDAKEFAEQAAVVKEAFNNKYFDKKTNQYSNNTVTANLLSLCHGLVPEGCEEAVFEHIVDKTLREFNGHVSTGLLGIQWLMRGLTKYGRPDIAFKIATNRDYPSWGYMKEKGATTIWELWNGDTADPTMNSANHVMLLGDLIIWYYENLAGIQNTPGSAGFKQITMKPCLITGLDYVSASYHSAHGLIKSSWRKENRIFTWNIEVPCNTVATVYIPATTKEGVVENNGKAASAKGIRFIKMEGAYAVFEVGSGNYNFISVTDLPRNIYIRR